MVFPPPSIKILEFHMSNILMATLKAPKTFIFKKDHITSSVQKQDVQLAMELQGLQ